MNCTKPPSGTKKTPAQPMRWYTFSVKFVLVFGILINLLWVVSILQNMCDNKEACVGTALGLNTAGLIIAIGAAAYKFLTWYYMKSLKKEGPKLFVAGCAICPELLPVYNLVAMYTKNVLPLWGVVFFYIAVCGTMILINKKYYEKRKELFVF